MLEQCEKCAKLSDCCLSCVDSVECKSFESAYKLDLDLTGYKLKFYGGLYGAAVGDALGVSSEFKGRELFKLSPVLEMRGHGTHDQPLGAWSDDTSLSLCLVDALAKGYSLDRLAHNMVKWYSEPYTYKTTHKIFDVGGTTREAILNIVLEKPFNECGSKLKSSNGNGSLMRMLPLVFYTDLRNDDKFKLIDEISSLTHAHYLSRFACWFYVVYASYLYREYGIDKCVALRKTIDYIKMFMPLHFEKSEVLDIEKEFQTILESHIEGSLLTDFGFCSSEYISGSGYCVDTLKAAIWCLLTSHDYKSCVLKAVNLGEDTDTTACVAGGLAGIYYGFMDIPERWVGLLERPKYLYKLFHKFETYLDSHKEEV